MSLDRFREIDAIGIDNETGFVTLVIADDMDWSDESGHLVALQDKVYAYPDFVESGEVDQNYGSSLFRVERGGR